MMLRSGIITVVIVVVGIVAFYLAFGYTNGFTGVADEDRCSDHDGSCAKGPPRTEQLSESEEPPPSLGIDLVHCPKAEPEELPPDALAGATKAVLDQVPSVFGDVKITEGAYAVAAYRIRGGSGPFGPRPEIVRDMCRERPQYGERLLDRSVEVDLIFPKLEPSASLSQHTVFVARFRGDYWVYGVGH